MKVDPEPVQLVIFAVPGSSLMPMEVRVAHSGLRLVLVSRESINLLDDEWKKLGVYFLLGAAGEAVDITAGRRALVVLPPVRREAVGAVEPDRRVRMPRTSRLRPPGRNPPRRVVAIRSWQ